ncbi:MAG: alpha/beta fold hydrolase [Bacteroidales bacterium]|nr:alpha/beta fold hydrolase [Bacteroidales bacterium]
MKTLKQFAFATFAALAVALTISSCSQNTNAGKSDEGQENTIKATYVLVHGGWCASWCWDFNKPALEAAGHTVKAFDLPGHGNNTDIDLTKVTLSDHVNALQNFISQIEGKVILVAHSMTGMVIAQVAENIPEKIEKLVFFAAFLPKDGDVMMNFLMSDPWTQVGPLTTIVKENGMATFNPTYARNLGFNTTPDDKFMYALQYLQDENPTMWYEPVHLSDRYMAVPKVYIHTLKDNCCSYFLQRQMVKTVPCVKEYYLDTDHVGMLSDPESTNAILLDIADIR